MTVNVFWKVTALFALAGCALPAVDRAAPGFDEAQYASDLDTCRGGPALIAMVHALGGALAGSSVGFIEGAHFDSFSGDSDEGALIGAIVGAVIGVGAGFTESLSEQRAELRSCLSGKGYRVQSI